jgi:hypothetical protein
VAAALKASVKLPVEIPFKYGAEIQFRQVAFTYHTAFSRLGSSSTLALEILGYFVFDSGSQQLPRSLGQQLFQIVLGFDFAHSRSETTLTSILAASFLFGSSGEAVVVSFQLKGCPFFYLLIHKTRLYLREVMNDAETDISLCSFGPAAAPIEHSNLTYRSQLLKTLFNRED